MIRRLGVLLVVAIFSSNAFAVHGDVHISAAPHSHQHGDADDHHSSPDGPCEHQEDHCCSMHPHPIAVNPEMVDREMSEAHVENPGREQFQSVPSISVILHVPRS